MRTLSGTCAAVALLAAFVPALSGAAEPLEAQVLKAVQCNAQSSIWLQGATFSLAQLQSQAADGQFSFTAELTTTYAGSGKQEKATLKGKANAGSPPRITALEQSDDDGTRSLAASCF